MSSSLKCLTLLEPLAIIYQVALSLLSSHLAYRDWLWVCSPLLAIALIFSVTIAFTPLSSKFLHSLWKFNAQILNTGWDVVFIATNRTVNQHLDMYYNQTYNIVLVCFNLFPCACMIVFSGKISFYYNRSLLNNKHAAVASKYIVQSIIWNHGAKYLIPWVLMHCNWSNPWTHQKWCRK